MSHSWPLARQEPSLRRMPCKPFCRSNRRPFIHINTARPASTTSASNSCMPCPASKCACGTGTSDDNGPNSLVPKPYRPINYGRGTLFDVGTPILICRPSLPSASVRSRQRRTPSSCAISSTRRIFLWATDPDGSTALLHHYRRKTIDGRRRFVQLLQQRACHFSGG